MTSPHLVLLHFRFSKTITNLNIIGGAATSEDLGICLLICLLQALVFGVSWMPCCVSNADVARLVCWLCCVSDAAAISLLLDLPDF